MKARTVIMVLTSAVFFHATNAQASPISGRLWAVPDAIAQNAVPANVPGTAPNVTFDVDAPLNFDSPGSVQSFLTSGGAFNIVAQTAADLSRPISNGVVSTLIEFTGFVTVTTGQQFTVTHDDGLTLIIGATNLGFSPGPTAPTQSLATYNGPSGTFAFELVYGECCGGAAELQIGLPLQATPNSSTVPEPATLALLGTGTLGLVARLRRRRQHAL